MDVFEKAKRSEIMSHVRGGNTLPELVVRRALHRMGYRYRLHSKNVPGRPDLVFTRPKVALFIHGCFWHRHHCPRGSTPATNKSFWKAKFARNVARDRQVRRELRKAGWKQVVIWQRELKGSAALRRVLGRVTRLLKG